MKKFLIVSLIILLAVSLSVFAQEKKEMKTDMQEEMGGEMPDMAPPEPLGGEWNDWMVGEWEGYTQSPMGKSKDWIKVQYALGNQYVKMHYTGENVETNEEMMKQWQEQMNLSDEDMQAMKDMKYEGMGLVTQDPKTGKQIGWWFDNWRGYYTGTEAMSAPNKVTMKWEGAMGIETRTTEKVGPNKMVVVFKSSGPMGEFEGKSELTRVMSMKPSSEKPVQGSGTKAK